MGLCGRCGRWLPVLVVVSVIGWIYTVFSLDFLLPRLSLHGPRDDEHYRALGFLVGFNTVFALGVISFLRAICTDPGRVPESWIVTYDAEGLDVMGPEPAQYHACETKLDGVSRRICRKSDPNVYKPDRAHFCRVMGRCVLKMDHFCPWLNNCIGFRNHKFFLLLIFYMTALASFIVVVMTPVFVRLVTRVDGEGGFDPKGEFRLSLTYLVTCVLAVGLIAFCTFHAYLLATNYTTIEFLEKRGCNPPPDHVNKYDLGICRNILAVMGSNPLLWLLPVRWSVRGNGFAFPMNPLLEIEPDPSLSAISIKTK